MIYKIFCIGVLLSIVILNIVIILSESNIKESFKKIESKVHDHSCKVEPLPVIYMSEKNIRTYKETLVIPKTIIEDGFMSDIEVKERLLNNMIPFLIESLEVIEQKDYIAGNIAYTGRIRVI